MSDARRLYQALALATAKGKLDGPDSQLPPNLNRWIKREMARIRQERSRPVSKPPDDAA